MSGKTEWEDALIKHGIMAAPPEVKSDDDLALEHLEREQAKDPLANKTLKQLDELEGDVEEDVLASYRAKRLAELKTQQARARFGKVVHISEQEFVPEVSKAPEDIYVVLHLFAWSKPECKLLGQVMDEVAAKHKDVKFLKILGQECIHGYPDKNCPTVLVYHKSDVVLQIIGLETFGGPKMNANCMEWVLAQARVLNTELDEDPRLAVQRTEVRRGVTAARGGGSSKDGDSGSDEEDD